MRWQTNFNSTAPDSLLEIDEADVDRWHINRQPHARLHRLTWRRRSALLTTDTDDKLMASAATIGDSVMPNNGYNTPAANGTPIAL